MIQNITREQIAQSYIAANSAYCARKGASANVNKSGINPDIHKGAKVWAKMTDPIFDAVVGLCADLDICAGISTATNTKKAMRLPMLLSFIVSGDVRDLKGSARTAFLEVCALVNGAPNRETLSFAATGTARNGEGESVALRDSGLARKLRMLAGSVKVSTEQTQNSVTFSAGGLSDILQIAKKDSRKSHPMLNEASPILRAMLDRINRTAESTLFELTKGESNEAPLAPPIVKGKRNKGMRSNKGSK